MLPLPSNFTSHVALDLAPRVRTDGRGVAVGWVGGSIAMRPGIWCMHFFGMLAFLLPIALGYTRALTVASWVAGVFMSAVALFVASGGLLTWRHLAGGALTMGVGICAMHYTGMAALEMAPGIDWNPLLVTVSALIAVGASAAALLIFFWLRDVSAQLKVANSQLRTVNEELRQRASLDPLTGLPNRLLLEDRLMQALRRSERAEKRNSGRNIKKIAVLFVDLDGFKPVNDSLGHAAGDQVLKEMATRLRFTARASDTVARIGGDEFVLLMEDVTSLADCVTLARRLLEVLARPFDIANRQVEVSGSVGIAIYPDNGHTDKLVTHADAAMYAAKRAGGNTYALFESHMDAGALEQLSLQNDLRHAIERGELQLHYQPKVDGSLGQIRGVEALLRWNHPERGSVSPGVFIPIAERFGLINSVGNWVIDEACRQMEAWADDGVRMRVAINISVHQLREGDLVERIQKALARHHVDPSQLLCEITESMAMGDVKTTQHAFNGLERIGVFLSIDDFGTGYSSLSYLRQLPARQLKIDRSFVGDIEGSNDARAIVSAIIQLAHALSLCVVAEGVETQGQCDILLDLGCDELQGFFFARPMTADALLGWTEGRKPAGAVDFSPSTRPANL